MIKWLATFILLWFVFEVRHVFPPIIVGAIIAYLLLPLVQKLSQESRISIRVATGIVYGLGAAILACIISAIGPSILREIADLANNQKEIIQTVVGNIATSTHWTGDVSAVSDQILSSVSESIKPTEIAHIGGLVSHGALSVLVCIVSSIYFTVDSASIGGFFLRYLPVDRRQEAVILAGQMNSLLSRYVQGQLLLIFLMSSVAWVFLQLILQMKYALPVAVLSGFLEIIPVLGPILAISTATLVGVWQFGIGAQAASIIIFYWVARIIEDYIVVPKIIGHAVELHPLAVIFAVLCGEHMAGALGMLIAIPVAACIKLFIDFFYFGREVAEACLPDATAEGGIPEPGGDIGKQEEAQ